VFEGMTWAVYFEQIEQEYQEFLNSFSGEIERKAMRKALNKLNVSAAEVADDVGFDACLKVLEFKARTTREQVALYKAIGPAKIKDIAGADDETVN
jgi:hypothetical protein